MRVAAVVLLLAAPSALAAQSDDHRVHAADTARRLTLGAMGVGVVTRATPAALGHTVTEGYLTQPMIFAGASSPRGGLQALVSVNLEGLTLARGEISPGGYGEGYMDRRHPHTYLHELMVGASRGGTLARISVFAGKGFVPFGTDDPMTRPFVKYPVNHHLAQILERAVVTGAVAVGAVSLEGARFNGDEPEDPADWPNRDRALDSWAARLTYRPARGVELSGSAARVLSPEFAAGGGLDQDKRSVAARLERHSGALRYALVEWARTGETSGERTVFRFSSLLAEGQAALGRTRVALRLERTERPEEDRSVNPYRSVRPLLDFSILGKTRWEIVTARVDAPAARWRRAGATMFVEGAWLRPRAVLRPTAVDPEIFYGASRLWMLSTGVRFHAGDMRARFGRYGAALPSGS